MRLPGIAILLLAALGWLAPLAAAPARAESVYRCRHADGSLAYRDSPCADAQRQTRVELAPAPPPAASPEYGTGKARSATAPRSRRAAAHGDGRAEAPSYECRAANGEVFYRHSTCPASIADTDPGRPRRGAGSSSVAVSGVALTRKEACRRLAAAGSIGRRGRERDERVSTYERNAGRDPCR